MKLSHSKLACILSCPMSYYLTYVEGISKKVEKPALAIGSAVHWGIEHDTEDLTDYFNSAEGAYTKEQLLAEAMVHGYLKHKDEIFKQLLTDPETGEELELVNETHELYLNGKLKSSSFDFHDFVGIVDLLILTNKGFIIIDYKTSTYEPDWDNYLDQIYRYIFLLNSTYPDVPIVKVGIVNIRKTAIRQKKTENESEFLNRMKFEYELNDEHYVNYHEYPLITIDKDRVQSYIENLSKMCDTAQVIADRKAWYINFSAANGTYGKSDFWDIFYHTPDAYLLYKISDSIWDEDSKSIVNTRDCVPIDMMVIDHNNVLNHYDKFKSIIKDETIDDHLFDRLKSSYICDDNLLNQYVDTFLHES